MRLVRDELKRGNKHQAGKRSDATGTTSQASLMKIMRIGRKTASDLRRMVCAPSAARTRDLLLRRTFRRLADLLLPRSWPVPACCECPPESLVHPPFWHGSGTNVEPSNTCLQNTSGLSETISYLGIGGCARSSQTVPVGLRCGQVGWSGCHAGRKNAVNAGLTGTSGPVCSRL